MEKKEPIVTELTLENVGKTFLVTEIDPKFFLGARIENFYLPTEVVIEEPKYIIPKTGRIYYLPYVIWKEKITPKTIAQTDSTYRGSSTVPNIIIKEIWEDEGWDGHVNYELMGFKILVKLPSGEIIEDCYEHELKTYYK